MRLILFPLWYKFKEYALINICCLLIVLMSVFIVSSFDNATNSSVHIPSSDLYVLDDGDNLPLSDFDKIFTLNGSLSMLPSVEVDTGLDFYNVDIPSFATYNLKDHYYDYSQGNFQTMLYPNYSDVTSNISHMPNGTYEIEQILTGDYPTAHNDLLIGEFVAISYLADKNLTSYEQLIGQEVAIDIDNKSYDFRICGVYSGGEALITSPSNDSFVSYKRPSSYSYYKHFQSQKSKEEFISKNNLSANMYLDSSINTFNYILVIELVLFALLNINFIVLMIILLRRDYIVIRYYKRCKVYLLLLIPIINLVILNYLFIKIVI